MIEMCFYLTNTSELNFNFIYGILSLQHTKQWYKVKIHETVKEMLRFSLFIYYFASLPSSEACKSLATLYARNEHLNLGNLNIYNHFVCSLF